MEFFFSVSVTVLGYRYPICDVEETTQTNKIKKKNQTENLSCCSSSPAVLGSWLYSLALPKSSYVCCAGIFSCKKTRPGRDWAAPCQLELEVRNDFSKILNNKVKCLCIYSSGYHFLYSFFFALCRSIVPPDVIFLRPEGLPLPFLV